MAWIPINLSYSDIRGVKVALAAKEADISLFFCPHKVVGIVHIAKLQASHMKMCVSKYFEDDLFQRVINTHRVLQRFRG